MIKTAPKHQARITIACKLYFDRNTACKLSSKNQPQASSPSDTKPNHCKFIIRLEPDGPNSSKDHKFDEKSKF